MIEIDIKVELYSIDDLPTDARARAISEHNNFLIAVEHLSDFPTKEDYLNRIAFLEGNDDSTIEELQDYILENIRANDYLYFKNGKLADIAEYTGKHEKSGTVEFKIFGNVYDITELVKKDREGK